MNVRSSRLPRLLLGFSSLATTVVGCSVIVSSDPPAYSCSEGATAPACPSGSSDVTPPDDAPVEETGDDGGGDTSTKDVDAGPLPAGSPCRVNDDCASKICGTSTILTNAITGTPGPICTTPCCNSTECAAGLVCINPGTGGGYCVPAALAQRDPPTTGGKTAGATCSSNRDCRSGMCATIPSGGTNRCIDTCCGDTDCTGTVCRLLKVPMPSAASQHTSWICAPAAGAKNAGTSCLNQPECKSEVCLPVGGGGSCRPACSSTAKCRALGGTFATDGRCVYGVDLPDYFLYCQEAAGGATKTKGQTCANPGECISGYCDAEIGKCLEVCARDADCLSSETCKPSGVTTPFLRCVPK